MMGDSAFVAADSCARCRALFLFDPELVISVRIDGERRPICSLCATDMDTERAILRILLDQPEGAEGLSVRDIRHRLYDLGLPDRMVFVAGRVAWLLSTGEVMHAGDAGSFRASPLVRSMPREHVAPILVDPDAYYGPVA